ncbi:MAG TPA: TA system VapC family ribonuclease toxin [Longimicrobiales bacterium]|nr:TA system VapC family ribonuclease toxin [Longimicrobiales bacterium]
MIALDTNVLVYAHRSGTREHGQSLAWLRHLAEGAAPWGLPVFVLAEFLRVVTHPRLWPEPSTLEEASSALEGLLASPGVRVLSPGPRYGAILLDAVRQARATGNLAFDAQIAAVCREHGISGLLTRDRDFARFPWIRIVDIGEEPGSAS